MSQSEDQRLSDEELLSAALLNPALFEEILDRYQEAFLRKAESILKDRDLAEDAVQETFVKVYRHGSKFVSRGQGSFKSWSYKVLMNTALSHYGKLKRGGVTSLSPELEEIIPDESTVEDKETRNYIVSILERMPENLSRVLKEFFLNGKSQEEIAREENLSVGAVKVRIYRAKEAFRQITNNI